MSELPAEPVRYKKLLRTAAIILAIPFICAILLLSLMKFLEPEPTERMEIYRGVYFTSGTITDPRHGKGHYVVLEIHWDTPGLHFFLRPFSDAAIEKGQHYVLTIPDFEVWRHDLSVLVNATRYDPGDIPRSLPGMKVRSCETVVIEGEVSHLHKHSYLMWWDSEMNAHVEERKPPPCDAIRSAWWGIGLQGLQIRKGKMRFESLADRKKIMSRTFIGVDPDRRIMWLMAFRAVSGTYMIQRAQHHGVKHGGQLDSGDATNLIIGKNARGVRPFTGIRGYRPLACYIGIKAEASFQN
jgi:hypothetical protein